MRTGAIVGIQDMGAAGLTCSTCEMGSRAGTGIEIDLQHVPQRETGMSPYEIMLSESQERMLLVAEKGREHEVVAVFKKWGLDAVTIGTVTDDGLLRVKDHGVVVAEISNRALADEAPVYKRPYTTPPKLGGEVPESIVSADPEADLRKLLASADIANKRWIWEQYDHMVRTNTIAGPGADAAVIRIKETGTSVAMTLDGNGRYCALDPRLGAKLMVAECCRNLSTTGALPVAATNNLNFGNPERPEIMAQLVEAIEGMAEACEFFETPITGGNVSLYNETLGQGIFPTPVLGIVGLSTHAPVTIPFKNSGRDVVLLGGFGRPSAAEMGGTQYAKQILGKMFGTPPALDMDYEKRVHAAIREIAKSGLAESAHDVADGGLAVALAECVFGGVGAEIAIEYATDPALLLFHEGPSRIVISTRFAQQVKKIALFYGVEAPVIGGTIEDRLQVRSGSKKLVDSAIGDLRAVWDSAFVNLLHPEQHPHV